MDKKSLSKLALSVKQDRDPDAIEEQGDHNADCIVSVDQHQKVHLIKILNKNNLHPAVDGIDEAWEWEDVEIEKEKAEPGIYKVNAYFDFSTILCGGETEETEADLVLSDFKSMEASSIQVTMLKAELEQLTNTRDRERSAVFTQIRNIITELEEDGFGEDATKSLKEMIGDETE